MEQPLIVFVTAPSAEKAAAMARILVEERLAACVNILPAIRSIYRWEGRLHDEPEALLVAKTTGEAFERLRERVVSLHEYDCPEIVGFPIERGHAPYLSWLSGEVGAKTTFS